MTKTELLHYLDNLDFGQEYKRFVSQANHRFDFYSKSSECDLGGITSEDIIQDIFSKIIDKPEKIPKDIDIIEFRNKITGMINNAVRCHVKKNKTKNTESYDPTEQLEDDKLLDFIFSETNWQEQSTKKRIQDSAILDGISDLLAKEDEDAWIVLSDLRDGKKPQKIAEDNGIPIKDVRNLVKKIDRFIKAKASIPV